MNGKDANAPDEPEGEDITAETIPYTEADENGDAIPDFSRVGYKWSDTGIPEYGIIKTLYPPQNGEDATELIQQAIDNAKGTGTILLEEGTYNIEGSIFLNKSGIVLKGREEKTVLHATGTSQRPLIYFGSGAGRALGAKSAKIAGEYIPVGQFCLELNSSGLFKAGDKVAIAWIPDDRWISALKMDKIPPRTDGLEVPQWKASSYKIYYERTVTAANGKYIYLDNPTVMPLDAGYGTFQVQDYSYPNRITESGVEDMLMVSEYKSDTDEDHSWTAVEVHAAEHCWIRNVESRYFCFGCVDIRAGGKNITVESCICRDPKAETKGSRKYGFYISGGTECLVKDCESHDSRHGFATSACVPGPNVFLRCNEYGGLGDCGPHQRWASGVLYDRVTTDAMLRVQDRSSMGPGHGWAGVTHVFWNCSASILTCQSPWVTGKNYCIGCIGTKSPGNFPDKPDGVWISHGENVIPASLFEAQLAIRKKTGKTAAPASEY
ncbi:MAG: hypothetical protein ACI3ZS_02290 [Candidatus Cryptobacteroides sp.]